MTTTDLQKVRESQLVRYVEDVAKKVQDDPDVKVARDAAKNAVGLVVASPAHAAEVADRAKAVKLGITALKGWRARCMVVVNAMKDAVAANTDTSEMDAAMKAFNDGVTAFGIAQERRAAQDLARVREVAEVAAILYHEVDPMAPPAEVLTAPVATVVRGAIGSSHGRKTLKIEVVDTGVAATAYPGCFELRQQDAQSAFRDYLKRNSMSEDAVKAAGEPVEFNGLRATYIAGSVFR